MLKLGAWVVGLLVLIVILRLLGVDVIDWLQDVWTQIKEVPPGYLVLGAILQMLQTVGNGARVLRDPGVRVPGRGKALADRHRLRGRRVDEQLPPCQHRHLRDPC